MMNDRAWREAVRRVSGRSHRNPASRNPSNEAEIRRLLDRVRGGEILDERDITGLDRSPTGVRSNPQLQVIGDYRRNPAVSNDRPNRGVASALQKFHGKSDGEVVAEFQVDDGKDEIVQVGYLGHVPAISWLVDEKTAKRNRRGRGHPTPGHKEIEVDGELVKFFGNRVLFRGDSQPILALRIPTNEAVIVQGSVDRLRDCCDSDGIFGLSPVVEYIVTAQKGSTKKSHHYVHEFEPGAEPVLRWDESVNGLVFDRNRSLVRNLSSKTPRAIYEVTDWFHEKGVSRHGDR